MPTYEQKLELERQERRIRLRDALANHPEWSISEGKARRHIQGHHGAMFEISHQPVTSLPIMDIIAAIRRKPVWGLWTHPNNFPHDTRIRLDESMSIEKLIRVADKLEPKMAKRERKYHERKARLDRMESK